MSASATARDEEAPQLSVRETFRRGFAISPEFRRGLGVTFAMAVVASTARAVIPYLTQRVTDEGLLAPDGVDTQIVVVLASVGAVFVIGAMLIEWRVRFRMVTASEAGLATLRSKAFENVHRQSVLTQNQEQRGRYVSRVTGDVDTIRDLMQWTGAGMMIALLESIVVFLVMALYSWKIALVVLACYIPLMVGIAYIQPRIRRAFQGVRGRMADLLGQSSEQIVGVATIRSYGVQERMRERLRAVIGEIKTTERRASWLSALNFSTTVFGQSLATGAAIVVGTTLGLRGELTVGTVAALALLVYMFAGPLMWVVESLAELQRAMVGWRRVIELVDATSLVSDPTDPTPLPDGAIDVSVRDVRLTYDGEKEVLKGVSLQLDAGQRLAIVGTTGSGKTSLARLMSRFFDPTSGTIELGGVDIRSVAFKDLRRRLAVVPQEGFLFDGTILENLQYALPHADADELRDKALAAFKTLGLSTWLAGTTAGLDTPVGTRGELLSAGERQLVSIARAYLRDPGVLILDEATSAVDPATEVRISRALELLMRGRTAIVIAHRLSTAERADLVAVMEHGELVEFGPHKELVAGTGTYARLHRAWVAQTRD